MSIAIDDGPLDTMPNMSPSCTSVFEIFLKSSRSRLVPPALHLVSLRPWRSRQGRI